MCIASLNRPDLKRARNRECTAPPSFVQIVARIRDGAPKNIEGREPSEIWTREEQKTAQRRKLRLRKSSPITGHSRLAVGLLQARVN
jgi:hypothetical protein